MSTGTVEVPEAELRALLEVLAAADTMFRPALAMIPIYPDAVLAHAVLSALVQGAAGGVPPDPMPPADEIMVANSELMQAAIRAGFTENQAFELMLSYLRPFVAARAMRGVQGLG